MKVEMNEDEWLLLLCALVLVVFAVVATSCQIHQDAVRHLNNLTTEKAK